MDPPVWVYHFCNVSKNRRSTSRRRAVCVLRKLFDACYIACRAKNYDESNLREEKPLSSRKVAALPVSCPRYSSCKIAFCVVVKAFSKAFRRRLAVTDERGSFADHARLSETLKITPTLYLFFSIIYKRNNARFLPVTATYTRVL